MTDLRCFEDICAGERHEAGPIRLTREAIVAFAQMYDPQPFHLDEAAAATSLLGGLAASGWQTAGLGCRLLCEAFLDHVAGMGSPGVDELLWLKPVRPGDALTACVTVETTRELRSRPDRGLLGLTLEMRNGSGAPVMTWRLPMLVQRRGAAQTPMPVPTPAPPGAFTTDADPALTAFYEDVAIGHEAVLGQQTFLPDLIMDYARLYDPQPFHLDPEAAARSHFGGLCASGWQTAAFWMKHYLIARTRSAETRAAAGLPVATGGPSPGFVDLKWRHPVHVGQTVRYGMVVTGKRRLSRPGWGLIETHNTGEIVGGPLAFTFDARIFWPMASAPA